MKEKKSEPERRLRKERRPEAESGFRDMATRTRRRNLTRPYSYLPFLAAISAFAGFSSRVSVMVTLPPAFSTAARAPAEA